jgi:poly(hydroxyalkanoate) granule-associated protein
MAIKKTRGKTNAAQKTGGAGSLWLAGVGALSLARKRGVIVLGELTAEGRRLQGEATKLVREVRTDAKAQISGLVTPLKASFDLQLDKARAAVDAGIAAARSRLGIPSKADIDELALRVSALSRQLKAAK